MKGLGRMRRRVAQPARETVALRLRPAAIVPPRLLAVGSSTGGPQALFTLVQGLGKTLNVPVVLTQHMPATFTPILAEHISKLGGLPCAEAKDGEALTAGRIYLAPGDRHLLVDAGARRSAGASHHRPAGEFLPPVGRSDAAQRRRRV